ncbi:hypothetical protein TrLO_g3206 [Triparma laevis f. longispina]|uniref:Uncharacterized protein n=1 Tax=Triparma laevis f. longispina TaxID=1714387 RepID=A0A9W7EAJ9_9STRA|nr:hypothetical protein TrLO_g3206 [Triparma laevis f. longispina]
MSRQQDLDDDLRTHWASSHWASSLPLPSLDDDLRKNWVSSLPLKSICPDEAIVECLRAALKNSNLFVLRWREDPVDFCEPALSTRDRARF